MRKLILIAFLSVIATNLYAQTGSPYAPAKTVTPAAPKPQYAPDPTKPITITITLSFAQANDYLLVNTNGGPDIIKTAKDLTGQQLFGIDGTSGILGNYRIAVDSINARVNKSFNRFIQKDREKFTADTLAKFHPAKKN